MNATASIVSKVWSFCTTLRDDELAPVLLARNMAERETHKPRKASTGYKLSPVEKTLHS